jgi:alpha-D-ribose 1-methylphosphonate 5-triphosphate diphosphatase
VYRHALKGYNDTLSDGDIDGMIVTQQTREKLTLQKMAEMSALASEHGIAIASHDDDTVEKLQLVHGYGTTISEFPITLDVAEYARELGMYTMAGAPNVLLGGSHSGNLNAAEAIQRGAVDILCSDYYPAGLVHAVFKLHEQYGLDLAHMFRLVTLNPAAAVRIDDEFGAIETGKKADVLIIEKLESGFPVITSVLVDGKLIQKTNYRV